MQARHVEKDGKAEAAAVFSFEGLRFGFCESWMPSRFRIAPHPFGTNHLLATRGVSRGTIRGRNRLILQDNKKRRLSMRTFLQAAAVAAALIVPVVSGQAQPQGSNEAQGYAQSGGYSGGFGGAYASGRHHRHWR